jgi:hypothetical protein
MTRWMFPMAAAVVLLIPEQSRAQQQTVQQGSAATAEASPELLARARMDGETAALNTGGWFGRSVAIGALSGLIGTVVTYAVASNSGVELPVDKKLLIAQQPAAYQMIYEKGYSDKVRQKRKSTSLSGGIVGTAAFVLLVISSSGSGS